MMSAYNLVGKYVVAESWIDGIFSSVVGVVDSVFTLDGVTYAQIGENHVPISSIKEVFDGSSLLTPDMLIQTSSNLLGRTVTAHFEDGEITGVVMGVSVDEARRMVAFIDDGSGTLKTVMVNSIFDIRITEAPKTAEKPKEEEEVLCEVCGEAILGDVCEHCEPEDIIVTPGQNAPPPALDDDDEEDDYDSAPPTEGNGATPPLTEGNGYDTPPAGGGYDTPPAGDDHDTPPAGGGYDAPSSGGGYDAPADGNESGEVQEP